MEGQYLALPWLPYEAERGERLERVAQSQLLRLHEMGLVTATELEGLVIQHVKRLPRREEDAGVREPVTSHLVATTDSEEPALRQQSRRVPFRQAERVAKRALLEA